MYEERHSNSMKEQATFCLDLHGYTEKSARLKLIDTIDKCFYYGYTKIRVIHGHGTGKLIDITINVGLDSPLVKSFGTTLINKGYTDLILKDRK